MLTKHGLCLQSPVLVLSHTAVATWRLPVYHVDFLTSSRLW